MLTNTALQTASTLAYELSKKGISLKAKDNTYLQALVNGLPISNYVLGADSGQTPEFILNELACELANMKKDVSSAHDNAQDIVISELVKLVPKHLSFVKNQVVPAINETMDETFKMFDSLINKDPTIDFNIIEVAPYKYLFSHTVQSLANNYKGMSPLKVENEYNFVFDATNYDSDARDMLLTELLESMQTQYTNLGIEDLDVIVTKSNVESLLNDFCHHGFSNDITFSFNNIDAANKRLLSLMIIDTLSANPSLAKKVTKLGENKFENFKEQARRYLLPSIEKFITQYTVNLSNDPTKTLVLSVDKKTKTVCVDSSVYQQFLSNGGKVESIFGLLITEKQNYSLYMYQALLNKSLDLAEVYNKYVSMYGLYTSTELLNYFKSHFDQIVTGFIQSSPTEVEKDFYSKNTKVLESVRSILKQEISKLTTESLKDKEAIYKTGSMLIAKSRFYFTPAFFILDTMSKLENQGEKSASSAATIATIYYLTDFFFNQIKY